MPEPFRAAVYYAPECDDPLWHVGCRWLGRDAQTNAELAQPDVAGIMAATSDPRRYGFHATLKPPMQLAHGYQRFLSDVEMVASKQISFVMPPLTVVDVLGFLAICPAAPSAELDALAAGCVCELDVHRVPEDSARQAKRMAGRPDRQIQNIWQFGYPYVLADWQFHMTLSNLGDYGLLNAARQYFATALPVPRSVQSLAVFIEAVPGSAFELAARLPLGGS
ncbi:MAG: hypothetical protein B7Z80_23685 [Rhodospirillales bacterium 20-64-7]|nr:MAG: hypothetical protein B7Z80_23685 [Rhodospirillales bacterium 20-64-7]